MKKLSFILTLLAATMFAQAETIEHIFHFSQPTISERDGYQQIGFQDCLPKGTIGEPTLPWQSVSLMLPQGQKAVTVDVEFSDYVELEGSFNLYPYQPPRPYSCEKEIPFAKNADLYRSTAAYPTHNYSNVTTQYLNGVAFAFAGFTPVLYVPATGKVKYAQTVTVTIETATSRDDHSRKLWLTPENEASFLRLAQNPSVLNTYSKRNREIGGYDMLVITAEGWMKDFEDYLNLYNDKGIRTRMVSLETIYGSMTGYDPQEQIRNYIIQEYETNGIQMVILGGDVSIVPYRSLYCWAQEGEEDQLPSDMYYACLDGSLNDDGDDRWGEVGEDDLLPELGIGRLPFNNEAQLETILHKTFSYLQSPVLGEFTSPILGAEHLGDGYFGSNDMERLIGENNDFDYTTYGYPEDYNFKRYYATPQHDFMGGEFRNLIGTGGQYVHHVGHANSDYVAGWTGSMMSDSFFSGNDGITHNYQIFHSHGCICGNFPSSCVLEKMITIPTGFVVTTGNSRYGWYVPWGDGMAAHIHREFVDAYCHDHIATVGMALREAKIATAPWVTMYGEENGCLRWNIYCLNVLGDAALYPWFEEPFTPNVVYEQGLMVGTTSTTVQVSHFDTPLDNFCVSLFDGETLLARGITDQNGDADLSFEPLETVGALKLIVTGQSAWPQILEVTGFESGEAFVYGDILALNGEAEFGSSRFVSVAIYNKGDVSAFNIYPEITVECEYVTSVPGNLIIAELPANSSEQFDQGGLIQIADNIPDNTIFTLELTTYEGDVTHTTQKNFIAKAPNLQFGEIEVDDSEGDHNGYVDPGERITLKIHGKNCGHAIAPDAYLTIACDDERIHFDDDLIQIGSVNEQDDFIAELGFVCDNDIMGGSIFHFNLELHTGAYTTTFEYNFSIGIALETFESGDFSFLEWEHGGTQHWFITDEESHNGSYSARTGAIGDNEETNLIVYADIINDGEISFWFKTSTENRKDMFAFFMDGDKVEWWSGENDWTFFSFEFKAGRHVFEWLYHKNRNGQAGEDCAWIDDITFPRTCIITDIKENVTHASNDLFPNPNRGDFNLSLNCSSQVSVFNMMGQQVLNLNAVDGLQRLHLSEAGMYFVRISNEDGVEVKKVVVE